MDKGALDKHCASIAALFMMASLNMCSAEAKKADTLDGACARAKSDKTKTIEAASTETKAEQSVDGSKTESKAAPSIDASKAEMTPTESANDSTTNRVITEPQDTAGSPRHSALPDNWVPAKIVEDKPKEKPAPPGQAAAVKLYSQRKYAPAAAEFEKFIKNGTANTETHAYLAYCEYNSRRYSKALQQFDWVIKNCSDNYKLRTSAERYASLLRTEMAGICPQPCLKPNDPRWQRVGDHMEIHWSNGNGWIGVTDHHVGQLITVRNGQIINQGTCPTCGGTGRITPLRDGAALPN